MELWEWERTSINRRPWDRWSEASESRVHNYDSCTDILLDIREVEFSLFHWKIKIRGSIASDCILSESTPLAMFHHCEWPPISRRTNWMKKNSIDFVTAAGYSHCVFEIAGNTLNDSMRTNHFQQSFVLVSQQMSPIDAFPSSFEINISWLCFSSFLLTVSPLRSKSPEQHSMQPVTNRSTDRSLLKVTKVRFTKREYIFLRLLISS